MLFRKSYLLGNTFQFRVGTQHEDFGLIPFVITKAKTVVSLDYYGYHYVQSEDSITRNQDYTKTIQKFSDVLQHYDNMIAFLQQQEFEKKTNENMKTYYTNAILLKLKELKEKEQNWAIQEIRKRNMIENIQGHTIKQKIKKLILQWNIKLYLRLKK